MRRITLCLVAICCVTFCQAQSLTPQVVSSSGGFGTSENASLSWTTGETAIMTLGDGQLAQGFQQSHYLITSLDEATPLLSGLKVYPNPAGDVLKLESVEGTHTTMKLLLSDMNGKVLQRQTTTDQDVQMNLSNLRSGSYILSIDMDNGRQAQHVKLVKQ